MKETGLKIRIYGDKVLRKKSLPVKTIDSQVGALLDEMAKIMYSSGGVGLAAPQVGINKQLIVIDIGQGLFKIVNPKVKKREGSCRMEEACLSLPDVSVQIKRAKRVYVEGIDEFNKEVSFWAEELFSRALQHEIDHLRGKLIIDYASLFKKIRIKKKFKQRYNLSLPAGLN